jgi:hypothetical protein
VGDKGYGSGKMRQYASPHNIRITILRQQNACPQGPFHHASSRLRTRIQRLVNRCQQCRRMATRDEKRVVPYQAMWLIAAMLW